MTTTYSPIFTGLGINPDQADLYTSLIQNGPQTAVQLAKNTSVKRTYVYKLCEQLVTLGLIRQKIKGKTTTFVAENPDKLLDIAENQKRQAETTAHSLENILPTLKSQFAASDTKPVVTFFEGVEGFKKIHLKILAEKKEILAYVNINKILDAPLNDFWPQYYKIRIDNNITVRSICPNTPESQKYKSQDKDQLRQTLLIPRDTFSIRIEKNITGNKVAFFFREESTMIAMLIESQEIAEAEKQIFEQIWKQGFNPTIFSQR